MSAAIYRDAEGSQEIEGLSVRSARKVSHANVIGAPLESGQQSFDNKVIMPYEVVVDGIIVIDDEGKWQKTLRAINKMFESREFEFYSASDGVQVWKNLILKDYPVIRKAEEFDYIYCNITFVEAKIVNTAESTNDENSDYRALGTQ